MIFLPFALAEMYWDFVFAAQDMCVEAMLKQIPKGSFS